MLPEGVTMADHKLHIADIQTTELLYFDPDYAADCYIFCLDRDIDCLPVIGDQDAYYRRDDNSETFILLKVREERRLSGTTYAFHPDLLDRFHHADVQFVYDNDELTGVVHYSDYNRQSVSQYLYSFLSEYERNLRRLAVLSKLTNQDMGDYYQEMLNRSLGNENAANFYNNRLNIYQKKEQGSLKKPPFLGFYLNDLIGLLNHKEIAILDEETVNLRNAIMHADEMVSMADISVPDYIFDFNTFEKFLRLVQSFLNDAARVRNRITFLDGIEEMGRPP